MLVRAGKLMMVGVAAAFAAFVPPASASQTEAKAFRIASGPNVLAPFGHVRFCMSNPGECSVVRRSIRKTHVSLTGARLGELAVVNGAVNQMIMPVADQPGDLNDIWTLNPRTGDCDDYAVSKRQALLKRGWPSRALLLAAARLPDGQRHLVLIARTTGGDFVLDNLSRQIRPIIEVGYRWERIQDEHSPRFWHAPASGRTLVALAPQPMLVAKLAAPRRPAGVRVADAGPLLLRPTLGWTN